MIHGVRVFLLLAASGIIINLADPAQGENIFLPPEESNIDDIVGNPTPWVKPDFTPTIEEFKDNVFEILLTYPVIQNIWNMESDSGTVRRLFFRIPNKYLSSIGHPAPPAMANIISESASLHDPYTMPIYFEAVSINLAEFLLYYDIDLDRSIAESYAEFATNALNEADLDDMESVWQATLDGYVDFVLSNGFEIMDVVDELFEGFASENIVLAENSGGSSITLLDLLHPLQLIKKILSALLSILPWW